MTRGGGGGGGGVGGSEGKCTVTSQWLEHLQDHGNLFETWVVRATEGKS